MPIDIKTLEMSLIKNVPVKKKKVYSANIAYPGMFR